MSEGGEPGHDRNLPVNERKAHIPMPEPPQPGEPAPTPPVNPHPIDDPRPLKQVPPINDPPAGGQPNPPRY